MRFDAERLEPKFASLCRKLIYICGAKEIKLKPYSGVRGPREQAKLWRQGRDTKTIEEMIIKLEEREAPFLAQCLREVGPQNGPFVTNALPGESWHQWGEAMDCFVLDNNGMPIEDGQDLQYKEYGEVARDLGLTAGVFWKFADPGHVQLRRDGVRMYYSWPEIDRIMKAKFL